MDDVLRQLGTKRENFALLLTDAAWYMSLAGTTLKEFYPTFSYPPLMHVTCIARLLRTNEWFILSLNNKDTKIQHKN